MHDIKAIRDDDDGRYLRGWTSRGVKDAGEQLQAILKLDAELRGAQTAFQAAQAKRNDLSKQIGQAKAQKDEAIAQALMAEVEAIKGEIDRNYAVEGEAGAKLKDLLSRLPNIPDEGVPGGEDEAGNVEVQRWSDRARVPAGRLNATPKDHVDLGTALGMMDFEAAARMSGARFVVLKSQLARLERAIGQFMVDLQTTENGYLEVSPPLLVNDDAVFGTGQLPKFREDLFRASVFEQDRFREDYWADYQQAIDSGRFAGLAAFEEQRLFNERWVAKAHAPEYNPAHWLIPTAEVSLTNLVREEITDEAALPMRLTALTPCFRSEAGASGRDTRGMIRQHQFWKCELVSIATPETSAAEHDHMVASAQMVLERLELPYRTMLLCTGDMGFTAKKTFDLEVWLPSQNTYREISSISNCGDFQARRMDARIKKSGEKGTRFPHTLNGSGLAVGRTLVAILENYQDEGGRIAIPSALQPYMGGATHVGGER
jgi:seryl-tRNA synthetase